MKRKKRGETHQNKHQSIDLACITNPFTFLVASAMLLKSFNCNNRPVLAASVEKQPATRERIIER